MYCMKDTVSNPKNWQWRTANAEVSSAAPATPLEANARRIRLFYGSDQSVTSPYWVGFLDGTTFIPVTQIVNGAGTRPLLLEELGPLLFLPVRVVTANVGLVTITVTEVYDAMGPIAGRYPL